MRETITAHRAQLDRLAEEFLLPETPDAEEIAACMEGRPGSLTWLAHPARYRTRQASRSFWSCLVAATLGTWASACGRIADDGGPTAGGSGGGSGGAAADLPACERLPGQNEGATAGALTIRGRAVGDAGVPIANLPVSVGSGVQHFTSLLGTYALEVAPGSYTP